MNSADSERHHQAALDMLTFHGIDPNAVLREGVCTEGYVRIARTENGDRVIQNDEVVTEFIAWPKSFPVASFFEHYWLWKKAFV